MTLKRATRRDIKRSLQRTLKFSETGGVSTAGQPLGLLLALTRAA